MSCQEPLARTLPPEWTLHAVDLRGRGHSAALPGPYGFARHADDLPEAAAALGLDRPLLVGLSLGAILFDPAGAPRIAAAMDEAAA